MVAPAILRARGFSVEAPPARTNPRVPSPRDTVPPPPLLPRSGFAISLGRLFLEGWGVPSSGKAFHTSSAKEFFIIIIFIFLHVGWRVPSSLERRHHPPLQNGPLLVRLEFRLKGDETSVASERSWGENFSRSRPTPGKQPSSGAT